ncbi:sigma-70 family RNA polymerase sigma factor [Rhizobium lentis]|uniref:Sigma-70 family RNA polymerase sigma factor n=1 Tax=Rhizobium lentis TaxID=1138194 RepID=A0ABS7IR09_9HYPH|nr:sigma-70 family RNA polymerase sigma factor [Rhizobium lentis]MBX4955099.1 sigma-70 family RNA polymerase sigma factor [Rhizobium lentis]MBX4972975.1 sigma-70 family RNA polymerase sigma factor [Rhizobium lentis]MBX4986882.1 sigma-70 family RNA polymerase sigma factor [Rhizobium lentis]MBX5001390.1 sigma-70 family RNA polymerase sigma factor [Rhizobium lentis]MBX5005326.1 sigma-70 family RNA polymerase sigma factor [Rhizobium lentis]
MPGDEIKELIGRVALGDRKAFVALYNQTAPKLFAICLRILKDRTEAEEALQDVYISIWQRARSFQAATGSSTAWLAAIARNRSIDLMRARKPVADELDSAYDLADSEPDPESQTVTRDEGRRIDTCMEELEADRAVAVKRAYVEGLSYQELADQFDVPLNTMRTWLRRSLLKLRECMER